MELIENRTGEMSQGVNHLPGKHEDLSSNPQTQVQLNVRASTCNLSILVGRQRILTSSKWCVQK